MDVSHDSEGLLEARQVSCCRVSDSLAKDAVTFKLVVGETAVLSIGQLLADCGSGRLWYRIWRAQELKAKIILLIAI